MDERKEMCPVCRDLGYVYYVDENGRTYSKPCKCTAVKEARKRLERSGLARWVFPLSLIAI